ncbi:prepilin-type N-terminal cleavage/methylation domain-containing protein [Pelagibacterales bacterium SAG-MED01]|nr:prepilin-type N-terminal cleavage/methylation domain-containing protein [Pelagibacterales bacterium SAG-MED01]
MQKKIPKGFTLIELLVVMAIISILSGTSIGVSSTYN